MEGGYHIDPLVSLGVVGLILGVPIVASLLVQREGGGVPLPRLSPPPPNVIGRRRP